MDDNLYLSMQGTQHPPSRNSDFFHNSHTQQYPSSFPSHNPPQRNLPERLSGNRSHQHYTPQHQQRGAPPIPPKNDFGGPPPLPPMSGRPGGPPPLPGDRPLPPSGAPPPLPAKPIDDEETYIDPNTYHNNIQTGGPGASPVANRAPVPAPVRQPIIADRPPVNLPQQPDDDDIYELPNQPLASRPDPYHPQASPAHNPSRFTPGSSSQSSSGKSLNSVGSGKRFGSGSSSEGDHSNWSQRQPQVNRQGPTGMQIGQFQHDFNPPIARIKPSMPMPSMPAMPPVSSYRPPSPKVPPPQLHSGFSSPISVIQTPQIIQMPPVSTPISAAPASNEMEQQIYFKNVDRDGAKEILLNLRNRQEGNFLVRPGAQKNGEHPYSLSVYAGREQVFNLQIRRRADGNLALGTKKDNEQSFKTATDLIDYHLNNRVKLADKHGQILLMLPQF